MKPAPSPRSGTRAHVMICPALLVAADDGPCWAAAGPAAAAIVPAAATGVAAVPAAGPGLRLQRPAWRGTGPRSLQPIPHPLRRGARGSAPRGQLERKRERQPGPGGRVRGQAEKQVGIRRADQGGGILHLAKPDVGHGRDHCGERAAFRRSHPIVQEHKRRNLPFGRSDDRGAGQHDGEHEGEQDEEHELGRRGEPDPKVLDHDCDE